MDRVKKIKDSQQIRKEIYLYYVRYFKQYGYSPSYKEIQEKVGVGVETVKRHIYSLLESGLLATDHPGSARAIRVTGYEFVRRNKNGK